MKLYQISHFDYAQGKRVIDGHISGTDVYAAKYGYWATEVHGAFSGAIVAGRNHLHLSGGVKYTFTKIAQVA